MIGDTQQRALLPQTAQVTTVIENHNHSVTTAGSIRILRTRLAYDMLFIGKGAIVYRFYAECFGRYSCLLQEVGKCG